MKTIPIFLTLAGLLLSGCLPGGHISVFNGKLYSPWEAQYDLTADEDAKKDDAFFSRERGEK
jgi:hypothetical protein